MNTKWKMNDLGHVLEDQSMICSIRPNLWGPENEAAEARRIGRIIEAAPDFLEACEGKQFPDVSRLDWLQSIVSQVEYQFDSGTAEFDDRDAMRTAISEATSCIAELRAAYLKAKGQTQEEEAEESCIAEPYDGDGEFYPITAEPEF